jgi:hypothetical protein
LSLSLETAWITESPGRFAFGQPLAAEYPFTEGSQELNDQ